MFYLDQADKSRIIIEVNHAVTHSVERQFVNSFHDILARLENTGLKGEELFRAIELERLTLWGKKMSLGLNEAYKLIKFNERRVNSLRPISQDPDSSATDTPGPGHFAL